MLGSIAWYLAVLQPRPDQLQAAAAGGAAVTRAWQRAMVSRRYCLHVPMSARIHAHTAVHVRR